MMRTVIPTSKEQAKEPDTVSAFLVSNAHIDVLVNAIAQYEAADTPTAAVFRALGQALWTENDRGVSCLYHDNEDDAPLYVLHTTEATLRPIAVLKALDCYTYQSCEHPDWEDGRAYAITEKLRGAIRERHPELFEQVYSALYRRMQDAYLTTEEWERAPWGYESLTDAHDHAFA
jgi:hypothetical protein